LIKTLWSSGVRKRSQSPAGLVPVLDLTRPNKTSGNLSETMIKSWTNRPTKTWTLTTTSSQDRSRTKTKLWWISQPQSLRRGQWHRRLRQLPNTPSKELTGTSMSRRSIKPTRPRLCHLIWGMCNRRKEIWLLETRCEPL
jgi:hypothetical protein